MNIVCIRNTVFVAANIHKKRTNFNKILELLNGFWLGKLICGEMLVASILSSLV